LIGILVAFVVFFIAFGRTSIEFDGSTGMMRKKLLGFIPVKVVPFTKLFGINPVTTLGGGYTYRIFEKDNRYGKGIVISSGYQKNNDPNAVAFVEEAVTVIHRLLDEHAPLTDVKAEPISSFRYFDQVDGKYVIKRNKVGPTIFGVAMLFVGIHELLPGAWLGNEIAFGRIAMLAFLILGGAAIILAAFTTIAFDQAAGTVERKSPIGLGNKTYAFQNFTGIQTVRKSVNFIYTGTDVQVFFMDASGIKQEALILSSFRRSKNVERFINEVNQIMGI
jgi:hypothetical protein